MTKSRYSENSEKYTCLHAISEVVMKCYSMATLSAQKEKRKVLPDKKRKRKKGSKMI